MDQLKDFADDRLISGCIYCGGSAATREHVPSKVLLNKPFPENLPVVGSCLSCNNGFSKDEEYLACLLESAIVGSTDPDQIRRPAIANRLRKSQALRERIEAARSVVDGQVRFAVETGRVKNVLLKLARGHATFELSQPCREEPSVFWWRVIPLMSQEEQDDFDAIEAVETFGEVGSRGLQRLLVVEGSLLSGDGNGPALKLLFNDWVEVQEGAYRYLASDQGGEIRVKLVIAEYLACEVVWRS